MVLTRIPEGVQVTSNLLYHVEKIWYSYHDVTDIDKFPDFSKKVYLDSVGLGPFCEPINQPKYWASRLAKTEILGLLKITHFGRGRDVKNYIKKLMEFMPEGYIWMEQLILIDVKLITNITGLPPRGRHLCTSSMKIQRRRHQPRKWSISMLQKEGCAES